MRRPVIIVVVGELDDVSDRGRDEDLGVPLRVRAGVHGAGEGDEAVGAWKGGFGGSRRAS